MINLTVKTLDSQNHPFHVEDDITIRQFKEKISESLHIPPDSQRLIFCGRVLQDDKRLADYALSSGNTVHMVQRAPPQAAGNRPAREPAAGQQAGRTGIRRSHTFRMVPPNLDRNAMYLGAMAYPADLMEAQGIQLPQPSTSLCASRLNIARRMLRRAGEVLSYLENPGSNPPRSTPSPTTVQVSQAVIEVGIAETSGDDSIEDGNMAQDVTAAAIAATVSAAQEVGVPNITIFRRHPGNNHDTVIHIHADEDGSNTSAAGAVPPTDRTRMDSASTVSESEDETIVINIDVDGSVSREEAMGEDAPQTAGHSRSSSSDSFSSASEFPLPTTEDPPNDTSTERAENNANNGVEGATTRTQSRTTLAPLAALLDELNTIQTRLQPFMTQYHSILLQDPIYSNMSATMEAQRVFNRVSQIMHLLSHAYHAISDLMVDLNNPPPRYLRCRPILIQHSAVVQAGIPIHTEINLSNMGDGPNGNNNRQAPSQAQPTAATDTPATANRAGESTQATTQNPSVRQTAVPSSASDADPPSSTATTAASTVPNSTSANAATTGTDPNASTNGRRHFGFALPEGLHIGGNVEVVMEVSPAFSGSFNTNGGHTITGGNGMGVTIPFSPPSGEVLANIMQAVAGQIMNRMNGTGGDVMRVQQGRPGSTTTSETSGTTTATTSANGTSNPAGQNSQARVNTATHPTTSTQTRSTARPHVQIRGPPMHLGGHLGGALTSSFDPFLPCNSHHLRARRVGGNNNNNITVPTPAATPATTTGPQVSATQTASRLMNELSQRLNQNRRTRMVHLAQMTSSPIARPNARESEEPPADSVDVGEPNNIIIDLLLTISRVTQLREVLSMIINNNTTSFDRIRPALREFISTRLFQPYPVNNTGIQHASRFLLAEFRPYLSFLRSEPTIDDIDLMESVIALSRTMFPNIIRLALRDDSGTTASKEINNAVLLDEIRNYVRLFCGILLHNCEQGITGVENIFLELKRSLEEGAIVHNLPFTLESSVDEFRTYLSTLDVSLETVQPYLKKRRSANPMAEDFSMDFEEEINEINEISEEVEARLTALDLPSVLRTELDNVLLEYTPTPIVTTHIHELNMRPPAAPVHLRDAEPTSPVSAVPVESPERQATLPPIDMEVDLSEPITNIAVGSQPWHSAVPSDWVPIITRDTVRQRRQNPQPPFSDAYLQGLPSKRRKLIASEKPSTNVERAIQDGVRHAVDTVPHRDGPTVSQVVAHAATEPSLQTAYMEQLRSTVRTRLQQDPDFTPEKYPNTDTFFK